MNKTKPEGKCNCLCHFKNKPTDEEYAVSSYYGCSHCRHTITEELEKIVDGIASPYGEGATYGGKSYSGKDYCHLDDIDRSLLINDIAELLAQALSRKDEEWKEKVRGLRMEKKTLVEFNPTNPLTGKKMIGYSLDISIFYNAAIDEFNKRIDDLLK